MAIAVHSVQVHEIRNKFVQSRQKSSPRTNNLCFHYYCHRIVISAVSWQLKRIALMKTQEIWREITHIWTFCLHFGGYLVRRKFRPIQKIRSGPVQSIVVAPNKSPVRPAQLNICPSSASPQIRSNFWVQSDPNELERWAGLDSVKVQPITHLYSPALLSIACHILLFARGMLTVLCGMWSR